MSSADKLTALAGGGGLLATTLGSCAGGQAVRSGKGYLVAEPQGSMDSCGVSASETHSGGWSGPVTLPHLSCLENGESCFEGWLCGMPDVE